MTTDSFDAKSVLAAFQGVESPTLESLASVLAARPLAEPRTYPPQTILCHQGENEDTFYIVLEGEVAIVQDLDDGRRRSLGSRGPGEYFGELSLLDDTPRMANCITLTETSVLEVTEDLFNTILRESPVVAYAIVRQVAQMLRANDQAAIQDLATKNTELRAAYEDLRRAQASLVEKERLERELEIAATVQRSLLPFTLPHFEDVQFYAYLRPARRVGGDFYDAIVIDDEHVAFLLADVVDKSIHAALFMAVARTLFRTESRRSLSPAEVALAVHRGMLDIAENGEMFVTAFYAVLQRSSGRLRYIMGGHEHPLLLHSGSSGVETLSGRGRFLGMIDPLHLEEYEIQLQPGDRLLLFSDGVTDMANEAGEQFGHQRLHNRFLASVGLSGANLLPAVAGDVRDWCGSADPSDDLTMMLVEYAPTPAH
jgi:serine phosphatase RsbU (regulator of sigma subunit)